MLVSKYTGRYVPTVHPYTKGIEGTDPIPNPAEKEEEDGSSS